MSQLTMKDCRRVQHHTQLEERVRNLQHQDVWVVMLVADEDPFTRPTHPMLFIMLF